jgi:hypothetical protein
MKVYTGIGARQVPRWATREAFELGAFLAKKQYLLRSGAAAGMDEAFEKGCVSVEKKEDFPLREIWIPWKGFRYLEHFDSSHQHLQLKEQRQACGELLVRTGILPGFFSRPIAHQCLFARSVFQVTGANLTDSSQWSEFLIYWAKEEEGKVSGGTRIAVYLARTLGIPTYNLADGKQNALLKERIGFITESMDEW